MIKRWKVNFRVQFSFNYVSTLDRSWHNFSVFTRESMQMTFSGELILDHYWIFFELLSQGTIWLAIFGLTAIALLPDVIFMLVRRHFFPTETQKAQVIKKHGRLTFHLFFLLCPEQASLKNRTSFNRTSTASQLELHFSFANGHMKP